MNELILIIIFIWLTVLTVWLLFFKKGPKGPKGDEGSVIMSYIQSYDIRSPLLELLGEAEVMKKIIKELNSYQLERGEKVNEKMD